MMQNLNKFPLKAFQWFQSNFFTYHDKLLSCLLVFFIKPRNFGPLISCLLLSFFNWLSLFWIPIYIFIYLFILFFGYIILRFYILSNSPCSVSYYFEKIKCLHFHFSYLVCFLCMKMLITWVELEKCIYIYIMYIILEFNCTNLSLMYGWHLIFEYAIVIHCAWFKTLSLALIVYLYVFNYFSPLS